MAFEERVAVIRYFKNGTWRMAQDVGGVVVVLTKAVGPKRVVGGNDDKIDAKLKRQVQYALARITGAEYPVTVRICRADRDPVVLQCLFRLALILQEARVCIGSRPNFK